MHDIEPYYSWDKFYISQNDKRSPFYGKEYNYELFTNDIYGYFINPAWDYIGSETLYVKILYADYKKGFAIIEMIGEWNDAIENDIMQLKRSIIDLMIAKGIFKFLLICENVLNFHSSDTDYYQEWSEDIRDDGGWIAAINMPEQTQYDFHRSHIDYYVKLLESPNWRTFNPMHFYQAIDNQMIRLLD